MEAPHIIPFLLNGFDGKAITSPQIVRDVLSFPTSLTFSSQKDAARTWDMLRSWTQIDLMALVGSNINSPTNAIYMTMMEHIAFGQFQFYLDKDTVSRRLGVIHG
jgi:hypothetical protein